MKIKLDESFYIAVDDMNFTLVERRIGPDKDGVDKEYFDELGYYGSVGHALKAYMRFSVNRIYKEQVITLDQYMLACENVLEQLELKTKEMGLSIEKATSC